MLLGLLLYNGVRRRVVVAAPTMRQDLDSYEYAWGAASRRPLTPMSGNPIPARTENVAPMSRAPCARMARVRAGYPNVFDAVPAPVATNPDIARTWRRWNRLDDDGGRSNFHVDHGGRRSQGKSEGQESGYTDVLDHLVILPARHRLPSLGYGRTLLSPTFPYMAEIFDARLRP